MKNTKSGMIEELNLTHFASKSDLSLIRDFIQHRIPLVTVLASIEL